MLVFTATTGAEAADYPGDIAGKGRAHFDLESVYWVGAITLPKNGAQLKIRNDAFGVFGYRRVPVGLGLAYGASERIVVGARIDFSADPHDDDGTATVTIRAAVSPYVELMFMRDRHVRPFVHLRAGVGGGRTFVRRGERSLESAGESIVYPTVGVGAGAHVFLSEEVSFDALLSLDHRWNVRRSEGTEATPSDITPGRWNLLDTSVSAGLMLGFSRWF